MPIDFWVVYTLQIQPSTALFELTVYVMGYQVFLLNQGVQKSGTDVFFESKCSEKKGGVFLANSSHEFNYTS